MRQIKNSFAKVSSFLKEVRREIKKVSWPTKKETFYYTLIVVGVSLVLALFLGGVDFLFTTFLNRIVF